jgi:hypothetical protein
LHTVLVYRYGTWGRDFDSMSSNFRELLNLVMALEEGLATGDLEHTEIFLFTENSTVESCFYKG